MKRLLLAIGLLLACAAGGFAQNRPPMPFVKQQFFDNLGRPCNACKLYTYIAGTTTPLETFQDADATTPNTNPIVLDSTGRANIFVNTTPYDYVLKTSADAAIWTVLDVQVSSGGSGGTCPSGSDTQVQFNDAGNCNGDPGLVYNKTSDLLTGDTFNIKNLQLRGSTTGVITVRGKASAGTWTFILPDSAGTAGQVLTSHGIGGTTWDTPDCLIGSGETTQVLFNTNGDCDSDSVFTYNDTAHILTSGYGLALRGTSSGLITINTLAAAGTWTFTLPNTDGTSGQFLQTDGSGVTTWATSTNTCLSSSSDTQVLFNDGGTVCAGDPGFVYDKTNNRVKMASGAFLTFDITDIFTPTSQTLITANAGVDKFLFVGDSADTTGLGWKSLENASDGTYRVTCLGASTCELEGTGDVNSQYLTAVGYGAANQTKGTLNSTIVGALAGFYAGIDGVKGDNLTLVGYNAGTNLSQANNNVMVGANSGMGATPFTASNNTFIGTTSGTAITSGSNNILVGFQAADALTTGSSNIIICYDCDTTAASTSNQLKIGDLLLGNMTGTLSTATFQVNGGIVMPGTSGSITMRAPATTTTWALTLPTTGGTNGYFLQTNGSGVTTWAASGGGGTCPAGLINQIQYSDGSNCDAEANLTYDESIDKFRVGIESGTGGYTYIKPTFLKQYVYSSVATQFAAVDQGLDTTKDIILGLHGAGTRGNSTTAGIHTYIEDPVAANYGVITGLFVETGDYADNASTTTELTGAKIDTYVQHTTADVFGLKNIINLSRDDDTDTISNRVWAEYVELNFDMAGAVAVYGNYTSIQAQGQPRSIIGLSHNIVATDSGETAIARQDLVGYFADFAQDLDVANMVVTHGIELSRWANLGTEAVGVYIFNSADPPDGGTDDATKAYGLKIENLKPAHNAIYTGTGIVRFGSLSAGVGVILTVTTAGTATAGTASLGTHSGFTTGNGHDERLAISKAAGSYSVTMVVYGGQDFEVGDTILIDGSVLGGVTLTNDLTVTVASVDASPLATPNKCVSANSIGELTMAASDCAGGSADPGIQGFRLSLTEDFANFNPSPATPASTDTSAETVTFSAAPGWPNGTIVAVGATASGLTVDTLYYVHGDGTGVTSTVFSFHTTVAGAEAGTSKVNLTGNVTTLIRVSGISRTQVCIVPYKTDQMALYISSNWVVKTYAAACETLGTLSADTNYDVCVQDNSGSPDFQYTAWGGANTPPTRATQNGVLVKDGDTDCRTVGSIRTNSTTTTIADAGGIANRIGGKWFLSNVDNQVNTYVGLFDATTHTNTASWRQWGAVAADKVETISVLRTNAKADLIPLTIANATGTGKTQTFGVGLDSTSVPYPRFGGVGGDGAISYSAAALANAYWMDGSATSFPISNGYHSIYPLENSPDGSTPDNIFLRQLIVTVQN